MKNYKLATLTLFTLLLLGCATQAQREYGKMQSFATDINLKSRSCYDELDKNPVSKIIYEKVLVQRIGDSYAANKYELLTSNELLSDELKKSYITYLTESDKCTDIILSGAAKYNTDVYINYLKYKENFDNLSLLLIEKKINIGEFNKRRIEIREETLINNARIENNIHNKVIEKHNVEVEQNIKSWNDSYDKAVERTMREQELEKIKQLNNTQPTTTPRITNCYKNGQYINCTTY